ncbi:MAG: exodeoxyribonuclease I [Rudaea sp.]|nr:exodeoxyribonuclease I [Rudaea sp.]
MPSTPSPQPCTFYWHDYETFGIDSRRDRPSQFAGQRTTLDLEPIGSPLSIYCKPAPDILPQPVSCLITGITPQLAEREGVIEAEFAARLHDELALPGTCGVGYNSIRFDDEFTRNLLYRNFHDPYEREWKDGNSRWDIIDLARMCYALRPEGIRWPHRERAPGALQTPAGEVPSFRLEDLASANHLVHEHAHDALSDVHATIALARLLRTRQPRLWDFYFSLRKKQRVIELLDWAHRTPVLHVSSRYPAERGCLAMVVPLAVHPVQQNKVIVYDLDIDPTALIELDASDIADRVFTARADLPDDVARIPLKAVSINKSPGLAPLSVLKDADTKRIGLDVARCERHLQLLQRSADVAEKCRRVFAGARDDLHRPDPELAIYGGFASDADRRLCNQVRSTPFAALGTRQFGFHDSRFDELLFRYRARNWPQTLTHAEHARWAEFERSRLTQSTPLTNLTLDQYFAEIAALRAGAATTGAQRIILDQLEIWGRELAAGVGV